VRAELGFVPHAFACAFHPRAVEIFGVGEWLTHLLVRERGEHLHLLIQPRSRVGFRTFMRVFAGQIAQKVSGAVKGRALGMGFWDLPAWSRIVEWGRPFEIAKTYLEKNRDEGLTRSRLPRKIKNPLGKPSGFLQTLI
jgi:hypothetical protein